MARAAAVIEASGLVKELGGRRVVDDVAFVASPGECVALVGANGAGKSTLLRLLVRLVEPDAGRIRIHGIDAVGASTTALRDLRRRTGFVFQHHYLVGRASTLTNVVHGALGRVAWWRAFTQGVAPAALRGEAMACLSRVGLPHVAARRADRLSGGQSQRVAIARALMQRPALLLADEPAASLDPSAGEEVMGVFRALAREEGMTVVFTSHHVSHALGYSDRIVGLRAGRIVLDAPTGSIEAGTVHALYS